MKLLRQVATSNTPIQLTGASQRFINATFWGISGFNSDGTPKNNNSNVYLGVLSGELPIVLGTGAYFNYTLQSTRAQAEDLQNFWVNGTIGNGVYVLYYR